MNVLGGELEPCSVDPVTGYFRDGYCHTAGADVGFHVVCAVMTEEFLDFSVQAGNDLVTPQPQWMFPGLQAGRPLVRGRGALAGGARSRRRSARRARGDARLRARVRLARGSRGARDDGVVRDTDRLRGLVDAGIALSSELSLDALAEGMLGEG